MADTIDQMLKNYLEASKVQVKKGPNSVNFKIPSPEGISRAGLYTVFPYTHLIFFDIHARSLPGEIAENASLHPVQLNYCTGGRIELLLEDHSYIYLKENDFCISRQNSQSESYFPANDYQGVTLYFDPDFFGEANKNFAELFELKLSRLPEIYFKIKDTYIAEADSRMRNLMERLWALWETESVFYMRLYILELLYMLLDEKNISPKKTLTFYTAVQAEIAKKAEKILTSDLKRHIPVKYIARQFGVSETSLKNYFRGVYGKNVSVYLYDLRMDTAQKLLTETKLPISEIASQIGYTKQGKFAEVFRRRFGMNPLEYRRVKKISEAGTAIASMAPTH